MISFKELNYNIHSRKLKEPIKIIQLTDLHSNTYRDDMFTLCNQVVKLKPDYILMTGDMINISKKSMAYDRKNLEVVYDLINILKNRLKDSCNIIYGLGNHELYLKENNPQLFKEFVKSIEENGAILLDDENLLLEKENILISGISLSMKYYPKLRPYSFKDFKLNSIFLGNNDYYKIALLHNPYAIYSISNEYDLALSGHMHGGGIGVGKRGLLSPNLLPLPSLVKGCHSINKCKLIISSGIGDHSIIFRINNPFTILSINLNNEEN